MFVCSGNICRSPIAHRLLEARARERGIGEDLLVESSGTGSWHVGEDIDVRMRRTAARHGLEIHHRARELTRRDLAEYDLLFAMAHSHLRELNAVAGRMTDGAAIRDRLRLFRQYDPAAGGEIPIPAERAPDTPDPYYDGLERFEEVYEIVERTCGRILDEIQAGRLP